MEDITVPGGTISIEGGKVVGGHCSACSRGCLPWLLGSRYMCHAGHTLAQHSEVAEALDESELEPLDYETTPSGTDEQDLRDEKAQAWRPL